MTADDKTRAAGQANPTLTASYSGFVGGETLATSGVTGTPALSTTTTNVAGTYPITAAQGTLSAANYSFSFVNGVLTVTPAGATLASHWHPASGTATAGVPFAQQPVIYVTDAAGNLVNTNGLVITAARAAGAGTLQGTLTATTVGGVATFTNLSHNVATTITLNFTSGALTNATSQQHRGQRRGVCQTPVAGAWRDRRCRFSQRQDGHTQCAHCRHCLHRHGQCRGRFLEPAHQRH